jgi:hypothetical protein
MHTCRSSAGSKRTQLHPARARPLSRCSTSRATTALPADADLRRLLFYPTSLRRPPQRLYPRECAPTPEHVLRGGLGIAYMKNCGTPDGVGEDTEPASSRFAPTAEGGAVRGLRRWGKVARGQAALEYGRKMGRHVGQRSGTDAEMNLMGRTKIIEPVRWHRCVICDFVEWVIVLPNCLKKSPKTFCSNTCPCTNLDPDT